MKALDLTSWLQSQRYRRSRLKILLALLVMELWSFQIGVSSTHPGRDDDQLPVGGFR